MNTLTPFTPASATSLVRLSQARRGFCGTVVALQPRATAGGIDTAELERRLLEMGFVEGAQVAVLHEGPFGRDPIAVRVDDATVALRRRDADMILVAPETPAP